MRGSPAKVCSQRSEGVDVGAQVLGDSDTSVAGTVEGQLKGREQASRSRDGRGQESELAQSALPVLLGDTLSQGQVAEQLGKFRLVMGRQLDCLACVNQVSDWIGVVTDC